MPTYRYYTRDLLTNALLGDLELKGVFAQKRLNKSGNFNGTVEFTDNKVLDSIMVGMTIPGKTAIFIERDGVTVWGGILWTRTYNTQSRAFQLSAQTFESYFEHMVFEQHVIYQKVEQGLIFSNCLIQLQAQASANIGLSIASVPTTGVVRTVLLPNYEFHFGIDAMEQLIGVDGGMEYIIDPTKVIRLAYPKLGAANAQLYFEYPGDVIQYWMPESAVQAGVKHAALGAGSGNKVVRGVATDQNALNDGYPSWWSVKKYPNVVDLNTIQNRVAADAQANAMPVRSPTFDIKPDLFTQWNAIGDTITVRIEDVRYPDGVIITSRMIGWDLTPETGDNIELLKLVIEGADDA